ncbi:16S rRNA (uracil(1498)-N(3))-methyltransferase [Lipingzhangella sp. LS1_29]|uniref:Ribosomal RNA small subunit methyltransferase E n=1 Tax=Lipingzhangella rawalii TaxID=2055835 RepID=A0ABU2H795_9ACTN|nr:16S rRNA (uracil(1498)-N(3))-methyltransferase [Lipingzhangella rawalii]MDS1271181.1 16S rRNA (uracil(1498)-N(3))-methyltransferase [Lipingzhangella rawalii]
MTPPLFLITPEELDGDRIVLAGAEGRHAAAVRRLRAGEVVDLADGAGRRARCTVQDVAADRSSVSFVAQTYTTEPVPQPWLTVVQAIPKGEHGELAVELLTEAGADRIVPWEAERCVARWRVEGGRRDKALRKWRATARESAKQCRRARIPEVSDPVRGPDAAERLSGAGLGLLLDSEDDSAGDPGSSPASSPDGAGDAPTAPIVDTDVPSYGEIVIVVGPEGGFSPPEYRAFAEAGAQRVRLGPTVLRSATAGFAALTVLQARTGRWR